MQPQNNVNLRHLDLEWFRLYPELSLDIPAEGLRLIGPNGSGKTSILEAVQLLSTTRSRRGAVDADLINYQSGADLGVAPYSRVLGSIERDDAIARISIYIENDESRGGTRKVIRVADSPRRAMDVVGLLPTVSFSPEDLELVVGSPSVRRRFLDVVVSQTSQQYMRHLARYTRMLTHRNGLLRQASNGSRQGGAEFEYWNEQLTGLGSYVIASRVRAVTMISEWAAELFALLAPGVGDLSVDYESTLGQSEEWWQGMEPVSNSVVDVAQRVGVRYETRLGESFHEDLQRGSTLTGPHRDDLRIRIDGRDLARFGSRGQQRLAVIALKLAEIRYLANESGVQPVLLLDDVLSELDPARRTSLIDTVRDTGSQIFVSATEPALVERPELEHLARATLDEPGMLAMH